MQTPKRVESLTILDVANMVYCGLSQGCLMCIPFPTPIAIGSF